MELNLIREILENRKPGTFTNITYVVECPVKAEYKKQGIKVRKTVSAVVRFDINYRNIASVKAKKEKETETDTPKKPRTNNYVPITENMLYHNTNTNKDYLNVYSVRNHYPKNRYEVSMPFFGDNAWQTFSESEIRSNHLLIDSYIFNKVEPMYRININNILSIDGRRS